MSVESRYRMSQERLEELKKELEYLQTVRELSLMHISEPTRH